MGNENVNNISLGDVLYLDWRDLPEDMPERNGSASLVLGQVLQYADEGIGLRGAVANLDSEKRTSGGMLCFRARGHRHEAAYGPETAFYVLTQEAFDRGAEGQYLGRNAQPELVDMLVGNAYAAVTSGHMPMEGGFGHVVDWEQVRGDLEKLRTPVAQPKD